MQAAIDLIDQEILNGHTEASSLNSGRSSEYVINHCGQKLHLCCHWPTTTTTTSSSTSPSSAQQPAAAILFLHDYAYHANRPTEKYMAMQFNSRGIIFVTMDFHGHGYSEGVRGLLSNSDDLIDDILSVLLALYSSVATSCQHKVEHSLAGHPLFLMGCGMGGGSALLASNILTLDEDARILTSYAREHLQIIKERVSPYFRGTLTACPLVRLPGYVRRMSSLGRLLPNSSFPNLFRDDKEWCQVFWISERYQQYVLNDRYPQIPHGLTYWGPTHLAALMALASLAMKVESSMEQISFPLYVFHDPQDALLDIKNSCRLVHVAASLDKKLEKVDFGRHDPFTNRPDLLFLLSLQWMQDLLLR
eukprot:gene4473-4900_t